MVIPCGLWAAPLCHMVDFRLNVQGCDVMDVFFHERLWELAYDCGIAADCAWGQDVPLRFYVLAGGGLECHVRLFPIPFHFAQFCSHGLHGFLLGGLVVKYDGVGLTLVHFSDPVGAGWQLFNLHVVPSLKMGIKITALALPGLPQKDIIYLS